MIDSKRKAFNFYKSYFDVFNELSDKDKILFIDALLNKQFYGIEPTNLKGIAKLAYISQKHNIDGQVKGFEDKTKIKLTPPTQGGSIGGSAQVEEEGKGKGKGKEEEEEKPTIKEKIIFPFDSKEFLNTWELWLNYRTQTKKPIKGEIAKQAQLKKISELANGSEQKAINVIMQSIENNWTGIFEIKNNNQNEQNNKTRQQQQLNELEAILRERQNNR